MDGMGSARLVTQRRKDAKVKTTKASRKGAKALRYKNNIAQLCGMRMNFEPISNQRLMTAYYALAVNFKYFFAPLRLCVRKKRKL
jgi:ppGpp synthetase/RelA/SpoT-type nucleotidyltranferase